MSEYVEIDKKIYRHIACLLLCSLLFSGLEIFSCRLSYFLGRFLKSVVKSQSYFDVGKF